MNNLSLSTLVKLNAFSFFIAFLLIVWGLFGLYSKVGADFLSLSNENMLAFIVGILSLVFVPLLFLKAHSTLREQAADEEKSKADYKARMSARH